MTVSPNDKIYSERACPRSVILRKNIDSVNNIQWFIIILSNIDYLIRHISLGKSTYKIQNKKLWIESNIKINIFPDNNMITQISTQKVSY